MVQTNTTAPRDAGPTLVTGPEAPAKARGQLLQIVALLLLIAVAFATYVYSEKRIDRANDLRHRSWVLADHLRQTSDDLTRTTRAYVVTGEPAYKAAYQRILDIRDGKAPMPEGYFEPYWDLHLKDPRVPDDPTKPGVALLTLMRSAQFTDDELALVTAAKAASDELATLELEAIRLSESTGPDAAANKARAISMLFDEGYVHAKARIMQPINDVFRSMDRRTADRVAAESGNALAFRLLFLVILLAAIFKVWRTHRALRGFMEAKLHESRKLASLGTLAGGVAHDFNNIVATILGNAELALGDVAADSAARESLEEIRKAGRRGRELVRQILSFSRRQSVELLPLALAPVIEESVQLLRAMLPARVELAAHCEDNVPAVLADANQLQQVLINLATNSMQALQGRPGHIDIQLDAVTLDEALVRIHPQLRVFQGRNGNRAARITVRDDGVGMDAATMERAFEPFFTTKPAGEGTGLGLSVVYGILQTHGGAVLVHSEKGQGTTFTLYLPAAQAETGAATASPPAAAASSVQQPAPGHGDGKRILYVDDDGALVFLVTRMLQKRGYRVSGFSSPQEALDSLRARPEAFDLVLSDYNMPGLSGLDVARETRLVRPSLPVAIISGFVDETLQEQAASAGVKSVLFKATEVEELCDTIARLVNTFTH